MLGTKSRVKPIICLNILAAKFRIWKNKTRAKLPPTLPEVSTPVLNPDSHFRLSTVTTSNAKHMLKTWTIRNWSGVARVPGNILYDREFLFADHRWRWRLYPGGVLDNVGDNVSLYLDCRDATEKHKAFASAIRFAL